MTFGRTLRLYRHPVPALILCSTFLLRGASYLCLPFMTLLLFRDTHLSPYVIGALVGLYQLGSVGAAMVSGVLADRLGRRLVLLAGLYGTTATYLAFYVLLQFYGGAAWFPLVFGLLNLALGIASAFFHPVTQVILAEHLEKDERALAFQHRYVLISVGALVCPPLGAYLGMHQPGTAFLIVGVLHLAFSAFFTRLHVNIRSSPERVSFAASLAVLAHDRRFLCLTLCGFLFALAASQLDTNVSQLIASRFSDGPRFFSIVLAINALTVFTLQPVLGRLTEHWPPLRTIVAGTALLAAASALFHAFGDSKFDFVMLNALTMVASMLVIPVASAVVDELAPAHLRGTYFGAASLRNLGQALGPASGGAAITLFGPDALFAFMALCGVAAGAAALGVVAGQRAGDANISARSES